MVEPSRFIKDASGSLSSVVKRTFSALRCFVETDQELRIQNRNDSVKMDTDVASSLSGTPTAGLDKYHCDDGRRLRPRRPLRGKLILIPIDQSRMNWRTTVFIFFGLSLLIGSEVDPRRSKKQPRNHEKKTNPVE